MSQTRWRREMGENPVPFFFWFVLFLIQEQQSPLDITHVYIAIQLNIHTHSIRHFSHAIIYLPPSPTPYSLSKLPFLKQAPCQTNSTWDCTDTINAFSCLHYYHLIPHPHISLDYFPSPLSPTPMPPSRKDEEKVLKVS